MILGAVRKTIKTWGRCQEQAEVDLFKALKEWCDKWTPAQGKLYIQVVSADKRMEAKLRGKFCLGGQSSLLAFTILKNKKCLVLSVSLVLIAIQKAYTSVIK